ncbi:right-handed parallel beta-helix repeat-containing protein [Candidatus Parcubacteria bacterium]|nr:right-handed parallel beta-helix repeat-containing protein [Candidatus Parcubacteria bacterium]
MIKSNKKVVVILTTILFLLILSGVVFAFQKNDNLEFNNKDLLKEFGSDGIRSVQVNGKNNDDEIPPAPFVKGGDDDDTIINNQKQTIAQKIDFIAKIGKGLFGIEKKIFFRPLNKLVEFKNYKEPKTINVPEDYSEIQTAIDSANFGDTIKVAGGEYMENIIMKEGINLIGSNEFAKSETEPKATLANVAFGSVSDSEQTIIDETIINGGGFGNVVSFKNGITNKTKLAGFTIKNSGENLSGILIENSSPLINDNILKNNEYGVYIKENSSPVIQRNTINFNNKGIQVYSFAEDYEDSESSEDSESDSNLAKPMIIDNLITDNKIGIDLHNSSAIINHNTISYNNHYKTYLGPTFGIYIAKSSAEITNNIITDNGICDLCAGINADEKSKNVVISYNNIWGNKNNFVCFGECVLEDNNLSADPKFVNCVTSNFKLKEESGLIGMCEDGSDVGVRW